MFICGKCGYEEEHKNNIPTFLSPRNSTYGSATNSHNFSPPRKKFEICMTRKLLPGVMFFLLHFPGKQSKEEDELSTL